MKPIVPRYRENHWTTREFYDSFKESFLEGKPILLENSFLHEELDVEKYVSELYFDLENDFLQHNNFDKFYEEYLRFKKSYNIYYRYPNYESFVDFLISQEKIEEALEEWVVLQEEQWEHINMQFTYRPIEINRLIQFENLLKRGVINGYHVHNIAYKGNQLTAFGKRNKEDVFKVVDTIIESYGNKSFFNWFFDGYSFDESKNKTFPFDYYEKFFVHDLKSKAVFKKHKLSEDLAYGSPPSFTKKGMATQSFAYFAMCEKASALLREAENEYRLSIGAKKVGESWISETELFYKLKNAFNGHEVIHHGRPEWLGRQHFDIWFPELKVAIEYQGKQHDEPIEFFGGQKAFEKNKKRDLIKKAKSEKNNVTLIEVRENYKLEKLVTEIKRLDKK